MTSQALNHAFVTLRAAAVYAGGSVRKIAKALKNRREAESLLEMSDAHLSDIGLTRDDIRQALHSSLLNDPSLELSRLYRLNRFD